MIVVIAITLIVMGIFFFARAIGLVEDETLNVVWPLLVVVLGLGVLASSNLGHKCKGKNCVSCKPVDFSGAGPKNRKKR